jgi:hypothetical protein
MPILPVPDFLAEYWQKVEGDVRRLKFLGVGMRDIVH